MMKKLLFVITTTVLTTQGCTVSIGPADRNTHDHVHVPAVSTPEHKGTVGVEGVRGPERSTGTKGPAGQVMGRSSLAHPHNAHPPVSTAVSKPEPPFGKKLWANIISNSAPTVIPMIIAAWLK